jgi:hypothetical protein
MGSISCNLTSLGMISTFVLVSPRRLNTRTRQCQVSNLKKNQNCTFSTDMHYHTILFIYLLSGFVSLIGSWNIMSYLIHRLSFFFHSLESWSSLFTFNNQSNSSQTLPFSKHVDCKIPTPNNVEFLNVLGLFKGPATLLWYTHGHQDIFILGPPLWPWQIAKRTRGEDPNTAKALKSTRQTRTTRQTRPQTFWFPPKICRGPTTLTCVRTRIHFC